MAVALVDVSPLQGHPRLTLKERKLISSGRDHGGRGCCAGWLDYDVVEWTGAVPPRRLYIEAAGSEADEVPIGGGRDVGSGSCCAGCQKRCCWTTTNRGGDGRRLASQSVH